MADNLKGFLNPVELQREMSVVISDRFLDEEGSPLPFLIKTITQEENELISDKCMIVDKKGKTRVNSKKYSAMLAVACCVQPDFASEDICRKYGVIDPNLVPKKMLLAGEFAKLTDAIMKLNGFSQGDDDSELLQEAKNS